mmetsp:Transcript_10526/g.20217  ORF Transcript_10526/g.20217 Transcript_10526/m.20217 type:complete len:84 (+) Transcript_10526:821-1072(+)
MNEWPAMQMLNPWQHAASGTTCSRKQQKGNDLKSTTPERRTENEEMHRVHPCVQIARGSYIDRRRMGNEMAANRYQRYRAASM